MKTSSIPQKVGASVINCSLVLLLTIPLYPLLAADLWKLLTVSVFFFYNMIFRTRCIGMRCVGTYIEPPTSPLYAALYSVGFATFFYSVWFPMDLLIANTILQVGSLTMTGNTLHGNFAGQGTMSRGQYLDRAKGRARLYVIEGKLDEAVSSLESDLDKWPDLQQPKWIIDIGRNLARDGNQGLVLTWIEGFE
jgi:hypothetical protein